MCKGYNVLIRDSSVLALYAKWGAAGLPGMETYYREIYYLNENYRLYKQLLNKLLPIVSHGVTCDSFHCRASALGVVCGSDFIAATDGNQIHIESYNLSQEFKFGYRSFRKTLYISDVLAQLGSTSSWCHHYNEGFRISLANNILEFNHGALPTEKAKFCETVLFNAFYQGKVLYGERFTTVFSLSLSL